MTPLQRAALARLPLTAEEAERLYQTCGPTLHYPDYGRPLRDVLESHEKLRAELAEALRWKGVADRFVGLVGECIAKGHRARRVLLDEIKIRDGLLLGASKEAEALRAKLAEAEAEAARLAAVAQGRAEQLERVALYLGHVARHGPDGDRTIAGLAIQEFARLGTALAEAEAEITRLRAQLADAPADY